MTHLELSLGFGESEDVVGDSLGQIIVSISRVD